MDIISKNISGAVFHLTKAMGVFRLSIQAQGAQAQYKGAFPSPFFANEYVPLLAGDSLVLTADPQSPIELFIDPQTSNVVLLLFYN